MARRRRPAALTPAEWLDWAVTERELQQWVLDTARLHGWLAYHPWTALHSAAGFPDTILVRGRHLIAAELKREGEAPTPAQAAWLAALAQVPGVEAFVWQPSDRERILKLLR